MSAVLDLLSALCLAAGAFFCLGLLIWAQRQITRKFETA